MYINLPPQVVILAVLINNCENSSVGRARPCQGRGRGFEPRFSLNNTRSDGEIGRHAGLKIQ